MPHQPLLSGPRHPATPPRSLALVDRCQRAGDGYRLPSYTLEDDQGVPNVNLADQRRRCILTPPASQDMPGSAGTVPRQGNERVPRLRQVFACSDRQDGLQLYIGLTMEELEAAECFDSPPTPPPCYRNAEGMSWDGQGEMPAWPRRAVNAGQSVEHFSGGIGAHISRRPIPQH